MAGYRMSAVKHVWRRRPAQGTQPRTVHEVHASALEGSNVTKLVIVESPAKGRTISGYLGKEYEVEASIGHIRDLPQPSELPADMKKGPFGKFAVNVEKEFGVYIPDSDLTVAKMDTLNQMVGRVLKG